MGQASDLAIIAGGVKARDTARRGDGDLGKVRASPEGDEYLWVSIRKILSKPTWRRFKLGSRPTGAANAAIDDWISARTRTERLLLEAGAQT